MYHMLYGGGVRYFKCKDKHTIHIKKFDQKPLLVNGCQILGRYSATTATYQGGFFIAPHLLSGEGGSVFAVSSKILFNFSRQLSLANEVLKINSNKDSHITI